MFFGEQNREYFFFFLRDKRGYHHRSLASGEHTAVHIIAEGLVVTFDSIFDQVTMDVDGLEALREEKLGITDAAVGASGYFNALLYAEIAGFETFGGQALRVHLDVLHHGIQLPSA